jgi:hypothetical protein
LCNRLLPRVELDGRVRLAVYDFKGRTLIFTIVLVVMMIPVEILMLPLLS